MANTSADPVEPKASRFLLPAKSAPKYSPLTIAPMGFRPANNATGIPKKPQPGEKSSKRIPLLPRYSIPPASPHNAPLMTSAVTCVRVTGIRAALAAFGFTPVRRSLKPDFVYCSQIQTAIAAMGTK